MSGGQQCHHPDVVGYEHVLFVASYSGEEHGKGSGYELLTGAGFQWKAAEGGKVPQGAVQVKLSKTD